MDLETLKTQHAELYAAIIAEAASGERNRVASLLKLGKRFHAESIAEKAILDGTAVADETLQVALLDRFSNLRDQELRQEDSDAAGDATRGISHNSAASSDLGDRMADAMGLPPDDGRPARRSL